MEEVFGVEKMFNQLLQQMKELTEQLQQQNTQLQQQNEQLTELQEIIAAKDAQIAALCWATSKSEPGKHSMSRKRKHLVIGILTRCGVI